MANEQKNRAFTFDASQVDPAAAYEPIPAGWYDAEITDADIAATRGKAGGQRVNMEFTVLSGDYKGRKFFGGFNVKNANPQAQEIGQREFSAVCHATGVINVSDLSAFVGRTLSVKVKISTPSAEEAKKGYEARNEPSGFKALPGASNAPAGFPAPGMPAPLPAAPMPAPAPAPAPAAFPPAGWVQHPENPAYYWNQSTNEVVAESDLRARVPAPAPASAPAPAPAPVAPAPAPAPVATFPPAGWLAHPTAPGWFYEAANPTNMKTEADLKAAPAPAPVAPPASPTGGATPPWLTPAS